MAWYNGKVAIVTGGSSGIGLAISKYFVENGARVAIADVNAIKGQEIAKELGENAFFCQADISSWPSMCNLFREVTNKFGDRIDYVIANAGISQMRNFRTSDPTHFATSTTPVEELLSHPPDLTVIDVNTKGTLYTVHLALAYFRRQSPDESGWRGKIVATGSNASFYPFPNDTLYGTSKAGVMGMVRALGPKVYKEKITVNAFGPSVVRTALGPPDFFDRLEKENRVTPISTITGCMDMFLDPSSKLTGQIAENNIGRNALRAVPKYMDAVARQNMNEFHDAAEIDQALDNTGYDVI